MVGRSEFRRPVVVGAFEGWNDAGDAATGAIDHLATNYPTDLLFELDSSDFYDYQIVRPRVIETESSREIVWPATSVSVAHLPDRDVVLVSGPEPNLRWPQYCTSLVSAFRSFEPELVILLGAMLTDAPHTRPLPVTASTTDEELGRVLGLESPNYEGPTGITGVLSDACRRAGLREVSLWASVPHYVAAPPNPKATLALLSRVEDLLDLALELDDLPELAQAWQNGVDELTAGDAEISDYIESLEAQQDENPLPQITGDAIAAEFERYLRRRDHNPEGR